MGTLARIPSNKLLNKICHLYCSLFYFKALLSLHRQKRYHMRHYTHYRGSVWFDLSSVYLNLFTYINIYESMKIIYDFVSKKKFMTKL